MPLLHQQSKVNITSSQTTPNGNTRIGKQCRIFFCRKAIATWHDRTEHEAQHGGGYKPIGTDAKALLSHLGTWSYANSDIIFVARFAQQGKEFGRLFFYFFQFIIVHNILFIGIHLFFDCGQRRSKARLYRPFGTSDDAGHLGHSEFFIIMEKEDITLRL